MKGLSSATGYEFKNRALLSEALTHSSLLNQEKGLSSNEKLEFLGDAVLELIITRHLYFLLPEKPEGELTRIRASIVCERSLAEIAAGWNLGKYIRMSRGEEMTGGRQRASLLADAVEAYIAAVYLDSGIEECEKLILTHFSKIIDMASADEIFMDHKTRLQELLQENGEADIKYELIKSEGPPHRRKFFSRVCAGEIVMGQGEGMTRKESEQAAARNALSKMVVRKEDD